MTRHFLNLTDAGGDAVAAMLNDALDRKAARRDWPKGRADTDAPLAGRVLAMIFEKNSTRTRVSFDMAMRQLGGSAIILEAGATQLGLGESIADTARVLSRMVDAIMIRTDDHAKIEELARYASVPVINGLTDQSHPCQIMADLLTLVERGAPLPGLQMAWLGDGNNVLNSLIEAAGLMKFTIRIGGPEGYEPDAGFVERARAAGADIRFVRDPREAVAGAQAVVTDCWISMGQAGGEAHVAAMQPYQVSEAVMAAAAPGAVFMHCLPAHRGEEVTDAVIDSSASAVWDEAENRIHAQKSVLRWAFGQL
ncbi:MAG: ornithine carbamoyltransferase [Novosphingobium sp.]|nr:ornithine carbamoyltransferase [Novosphingobium sp.]